MRARHGAGRDYDYLLEGKETEPMSIRIKWHGGAWWAYYNGWHESYFLAEQLEDMCNTIRTLWPKGTMVVKQKRQVDGP